MKHTLKYIFLLLSILPMEVMGKTENQVSHMGTASSGPVEVTAVFQVLAALIFIIILIIALAWAYRRYGYISAANGAAMKVVGAISLGGKEKAVLLQVGDSQVLLGVSPGYVRKIHDITEPLASSDEEKPVNFVNRLNMELQKVLRK